MDKLIPKIIKDEIDLYKLLDLPNTTDRSTLSSQEIRKAYKKQALIHHPDKQQQEGDNKFELILTSFQILSNPEFKQQYDNLVQLKKQKIQNSSKLNELILNFQKDLLSNEEKNLNQRQNGSKFQNLDQLREDGLKKRRLHENKRISGDNKEQDLTTTSIYDLPLPNFIDFKTLKNVRKAITQHLAKLKYKYKSNLDIDEVILSEIMSTFGPITSITINDHDDRYSYATIEFASELALQNAIAYDYSTASKWDGSKIRKLASLLRSCKRIENEEEDLEYEEAKDTPKKWTNNDYVNDILNDYYVNSVSDKKI
ncbi:CWC23 [Candida jiufengensis]|uniref:CWC23 n=1 Tax=Candida jiufengensis TaxID=497108 RepID=UPI002225AEC4|nr:CWC23 [Candida jiufengensis]KAI5949917.1 CWC23 [Candida jiufengensis]